MQFSTQNPDRIAPRISPVSHFFCFSAYFWDVFWNFCCFAWRGEPSLGQARRGEPSRVVARGPRPKRCNRPNCLLLAGPAMGCCPHRGQSREEAASQPEGAVPGYPHCIPSPSGGFWRRVPSSPSGRISWRKFFRTPIDELVVPSSSTHED